MEITGKKQKLRKNAFILFFLLPTLVCFCVFYLVSAEQTENT